MLLNFIVDFVFLFIFQGQYYDGN